MPTQASDGTERPPHRVSVVIPVYQGETTLEATVGELLRVSVEWDQSVVIAEAILVYDHGPDDSARVIRELEQQYPEVRTVWLTRNFGQHAATLAGMASTTQEWVVTMDEDGQHDPSFIPKLIATAVEQNAPVVYGSPGSTVRHSTLRDWASRTAKSAVAKGAGVPSLAHAESFRLLTGEVARSVSAFAGSDAYLDVVIHWVASRSVACPTVSRQNGRPSGYNFRSLVSHFWRLVRSSGTRPLRLISVIGGVFAVVSIGVAGWFAVARLVGADFPEGFATIVVSSLLPSGLVLISLGVIAEYLGSLIRVALGRPAYLVGSDPQRGPLGKAQP